MPHNLNGTDFCPVLLHACIQKYGAKNIHLSIFNVWDESIGKHESTIDSIKEYMYMTYGCQVDFAWQCHYRERHEQTPWDTYQQALAVTSKSVRILLNFIGAPYQEVMIQQHRRFIEENKILVLNQ